MAQKLQVPFDFKLAMLSGQWEIVDPALPGLLRSTNLGYDGIWEWDAWGVREVRDEFLGLKSENELLRFLNENDIGELFQRSEAVVRHLPRPREAAYQTEYLFDWQRTLKALLANPVSRWSSLREVDSQKIKLVLALLDEDFSLELKIENGKPLAVITCSGGLIGGFVIACFMDRVRGDRYRYCGRPDCPNIFKVESRHKRKFCSQYCGHLQSLRQLRRNKRKQSKSMG